MGNLKAGFAKLDITGFRGQFVSGYYRGRNAKGVIDPLYITAVAFSDGENTAVLISSDLLGMYGATMGQSDRVANEAAVANGLPEGSVFFHMTHTHTGPGVGFGDDLSEYEVFLKHRIEDVIAIALEDMKPVKGIYGSNDGIVEDTAYVRRLRMKSGKVYTWGKFEDPNIEDYAEEVDKSLRLIKIERENDKEIIIVNFQMHPDTLGGMDYCSDYVGALRNMVEREIPNSRCIFFDGAEGDVTASNYKGPAPEKGYEVRTKRLGENIAREAIRIYKDLKALKGDKVKIFNEYYDCPTKRNPAEVPESKRIIELHESGRDAELGHQGIVNCLVSHAYNILTLEKDKRDTMQLKVSGVRVGDFCFIGMPCEPFCEIGRRVRAHSKFAITCVTCQTNGSVGYIMLAEDFDNGGYEPASTKVKRGSGELLIEVSNRVADKLYED